MGELVRSQLEVQMVPWGTSRYLGKYVILLSLFKLLLFCIFQLKPSFIIVLYL